jgi:y4mF family transcriptional regulator
MAIEKANHISDFIKHQRQQTKMTQEELAEKAGVGIRFIRELEQGKESLRMDKVNQVLRLFGYQLSPGSERILDPFYIHRHHVNVNVQIDLKNKTTITGVILGDITINNQLFGWRFVSNNSAIQYKKTGDKNLEQIIKHADIQNIKNI